jgi:hypothetical protein
MHFYEWGQWTSYHSYLRVSRRSESITNPVEVSLTNMTYARLRTSHVWQPFATISYGRSGSHLSLMHVFHVIPHSGLSVGITYTIPILISRGMTRYHPTTIIIQLRRLLDPINKAYGQYIMKCSFKCPLRTVLNRHRQGLPPWSLEYPHTTPRPFHPMILRFPLVVPPGLKFKHHSIFHSLTTFNHFSFIRGKNGLSGTNHPSSTVKL